MNNSPYQQKMQKNVRVFGWFVLILISTFIAGWIYLARHEGRDQPSVEEQLNDTLFKDHSEIKPAAAPNRLHWPPPILKHKEDNL